MKIKCKIAPESTIYSQTLWKNEETAGFRPNHPAFQQIPQHQEGRPTAEREQNYGAVLGQTGARFTATSTVRHVHLQCRFLSPSI